jgi:hypothetical protein
VRFPEPRVGTDRERVMRVILEMQAQRQRRAERPEDPEEWAS